MVISFSKSFHPKPSKTCYVHVTGQYSVLILVLNTIRASDPSAEFFTDGEFMNMHGNQYPTYTIEDIVKHLSS